MSDFWENVRLLGAPYSAENMVISFMANDFSTVYLAACGLEVLSHFLICDTKVFLCFFFSESQPVMEKPSETALLLSVCGVGCVVLHQWPSSRKSRAQSVDSVLDCRFSLNNTGCVNNISK